MSKRAAVISFVGLLAATVLYFRPSDETHFLQDAKLIAQRPEREIIRRTKKLRSPLKARFVDVADAPEPGQPFTVTVEIESGIYYKNVAWEWHLPSGVRLRQGSFSGTLGSLEPGRPQVVSAEFELTGDENQKLRFMLREPGQTQVLNQIVYHSHRQKIIMEEAAALAERQREFSAEE